MPASRPQPASSPALGRSARVFGCAVLAAAVAAACRAEDIRGADVSFLPEIESLGGSFFVNSTPEDMMSLLAAHGVNTVRLRVWHNPPAGFCDLSRTLAMATRAQQAGLKILLDLHYSDSWADPGQQAKPAAWAALSFGQLTVAVQSYSRAVVQALVAQGTPPDIVQIGNEITAGMLWPNGKISYWGDPNWNNLAILLKAAAQGVQLGSGSHPVQLMLHIDRGADTAGTREFFDRATQHGVPFDLIGLSYYPWWHGSLEALGANLDDAAQRYGKPVLIAETAYPWSLGWADAQPNFVWQNSQLLPGFEATPSGQRFYLDALFDRLRRVPGGKGVGLCYWAPEYSAFAGLPSPWENLALFDFQHRALQGLDAFRAWCGGDLNADRAVDDSDFVLFAAAYDALLCP